MALACGEEHSVSLFVAVERWIARPRLPDLGVSLGCAVYRCGTILSGVSISTLITLMMIGCLGRTGRHRP
jgi:hypothetical protein